MSARTVLTTVFSNLVLMIHHVVSSETLIMLIMYLAYYLQKQSHYS